MLIYLAIPVCMFVIFTNMAVFVAISRSTNLQKLKNVPIVGLAVADVLVGLLWIPLATAAAYFPEDDTLCRVTLSCEVLTVHASIFNLIAVSAERWTAIFRPLHYYMIANRKTVVSILAMTWFASLIVLGMYQIAHKDTDAPSKCDIGRHSEVWFMGLMSVIFFTVCVLMFIMQRKIFVVIRSHMKKIRPTAEYSRNSSRTLGESLNITSFKSSVNFSLHLQSEICANSEVSSWNATVGDMVEPVADDEEGIDQGCTTGVGFGPNDVDKGSCNNKSTSTESCTVVVTKPIDSDSSYQSLESTCRSSASDKNYSYKKCNSNNSTGIIPGRIHDDKLGSIDTARYESSEDTSRRNSSTALIEGDTAIQMEIPSIDKTAVADPKQLKDLTATNSCKILTRLQVPINSELDDLAKRRKDLSTATRDTSSISHPPQINAEIVGQRVDNDVVPQLIVPVELFVTTPKPQPVMRTRNPGISNIDAVTKSHDRDRINLEGEELIVQSESVLLGLTSGSNATANEGVKLGRDGSKEFDRPMIGFHQLRVDSKNDWWWRPGVNEDQTEAIRTRMKCDDYRCNSGGIKKIEGVKPEEHGGIDTSNINIPRLDPIICGRRESEDKARVEHRKRKVKPLIGKKALVRKSSIMEKCGKGSLRKVKRRENKDFVTQTAVEEKESAGESPNVETRTKSILRKTRRYEDQDIVPRLRVPGSIIESKGGEFENKQVFKSNQLKVEGADRNKMSGQRTKKRLTIQSDKLTMESHSSTSYGYKRRGVSQKLNSMNRQHRSDFGRALATNIACLLFFIMWVPKTTIDLLVCLGYCHEFTLLHTLSMVLAWANSGVNAIVYAWRMKEFRQTIKLLFSDDFGDNRLMRCCRRQVTN